MDSTLKCSFTFLWAKCKKNEYRSDEFTVTKSWGSFPGNQHCKDIQTGWKIRPSQRYCGKVGFVSIFLKTTKKIQASLPLLIKQLNISTKTQFVLCFLSGRNDISVKFLHLFSQAQVFDGHLKVMDTDLIGVRKFSHICCEKYQDLILSLICSESKKLSLLFFLFDL